MIPQQTERLIAYLRNTPLLDDYSLAVHTSGEAAVNDANRALCGAPGIPLLCNEMCLPSLKNIIENALLIRKPVFFRCQLGLFTFVVPFSEDSCLICSGVRDNLFNLYFGGSEPFECTSMNPGVQPCEILEQLEKLPVTTEKKVKETMLEVERLLTTFNSEGRMQAIETDAQLVSTIRNVALEIGREESFEKAIALFSETLGIVFDIPAIALFLTDAETEFCHLETCWGAYSGPSYLSTDTLPFHQQMYFPTILAGDEVLAIFPEMEMNSAICIPLFDSEHFYGMVVLFNVSLTAHEIHLVELLKENLVEKLKYKHIHNETRRKHRDIRLLEMIRTLALTESREEITQSMMKMAAELVDAASGSLMLIDDSGEVLRIAASLGMNSALAENLHARLDEGIAGKVAVSGTSLLIKDIELERQWGRKNRIRFQTKSCLSIPLRFKGKTVGVMNLADKNSTTPFTADDQRVLSSFVDQATVILVRTISLGNASQNCDIDPLTGLYSLDFARRRLHEELSRSIRYKLPLTLLIVGLDDFTSATKAVQQGQVDRLVKDMAGILKSSLRDIDIVGRLGEKEFCVIMPSTPMKESQHAAERILRTIQNKLTKGEDPANRLCNSASIGIASFPENCSSADAMINAARAALALAEAGGGYGICCSTT